MIDLFALVLIALVVLHNGIVLPGCVRMWSSRDVIARIITVIDVTGTLLVGLAIIALLAFMR